MAHIVSNLYEGAAAAAVVAVADDKRKYLGVYAHTGTCVIGIGEVTCAVGGPVLTLAETSLVEQDRLSSKVQCIGSGTKVMVMQDLNSKVVCHTDNIPCTYDSIPVYYKKGHVTTAPVFR